MMMPTSFQVLSRALGPGAEMVGTDNPAAGVRSGGGSDSPSNGGTDHASLQHLRMDVAARGWRPLFGFSHASNHLTVSVGAPISGAPANCLEDTMSLFGVVVAAIISLAPRLSGEQIDRYAADIAYVAGDNLELALALVVVQDAESTWRESVETCKVTSDGGLAISSFQLKSKHWFGGLSFGYRPGK